jgi:hypothetical protein
VKKIAVCLQLYHIDLWPEFKKLLCPYKDKIKLYLALCKDKTFQEDLKDFDHIISYHENYGADIAPFLYQLQLIKEDYFIKIHGKKSRFGINKQVNWRTILLHDFFASEEVFNSNLETISNNNCGMICNETFLLQNNEDTNSSKIKQLCQMLDINYAEVQNSKFAAGTMFLSKTKLFQDKLNCKFFEIDNLLKNEFGDVSLITSGSYSHSLERIFGYIVKEKNLEFCFPKHEIIKIINHDAPNKENFNLVKLYNNECYAMESPFIFGSVLETNSSVEIDWKNVGKNQNYIKLNKNEIIKDSELKKIFDPKIYKQLNPDLLNLSDEELIKHYLNHGIVEKRVFPHNNILPIDFDVKVYKTLHPDLSNFNDRELILHYINHGSKEKRIYKLATHNDSIYKSFTPVFINHEVSLTGAPIFLHDLVSYFKENNIFIDPVIIEPYPNQLFSHYDINKYYHFNDIKKLHSMLQQINPLFIYSNSLNLIYHHLDYFKEFFYKTIFHFHESLNNLNVSILQKIKDQKIYVVAERIKKDLESVGCSQVSIFPPFVNEQKRAVVVNQPRSNKPHITNGFRNLDHAKVVVGMCGTVSVRKGFSLFYNLAMHNPNIEFIWIGGDYDWKKTAKELYQREFYDLNNFFHIPHTKNPYPYYNILDYFVLTSTDDPCPIVVLEALLLKTKVICLKNNIFYDHSSCTDVNLIDNSEKNETDIIANISLFIKNKKDKNSSHSVEYIENKFAKPRILDKLSQNTNTNFVVFSYYFKNILDTTDINYYTNLLNMFNINNKLKFDIIVYISIDHKYKLKYKNKLFNKLKRLLNLNKIFIVDNKGWNFNGLIQGIKYINEHNKTTQNSKIAHLHNKSNVHWRDSIIKAFYASQKDIEEYDTIIDDKFYVDCRYDDLNRPLMKNYNLFEIIADIDFKFIGGLFFITNLANLNVLYHNYDHIMSNLTTTDTVSDYWIQKMKDPEVFNRYYSHYKTDILNESIDVESHEIVKNNLATNYYDLYQNFGKRGIPDFHFEHALERYVGHLISNNKKVKTV